MQEKLENTPFRLIFLGSKSDRKLFRCTVHWIEKEVGISGAYLVTLEVFRVKQKTAYEAHEFF